MPITLPLLGHAISHSSGDATASPDRGMSRKDAGTTLTDIVGGLASRLATPKSEQPRRHDALGALVQSSAGFSQPTMTSEQRDSQVVARSVEPMLAAVLGDVHPSSGQTKRSEQARMASAIKALQIKVDIVLADSEGRLPAMGQRALKEVYEPTFPKHEAVPRQTIIDTIRARHRDGTDKTDGRFTLFFTGVRPDDPRGERVPLGFAQGGTFRIADDAAATYAEYWAVDKSVRGKGMLSVLMGMSSAVSMAAIKQWSEAEGRDVKYAGTCWEQEPRGNGATPDDQEYSFERAEIYGHKDAKAVVLERKDGRRSNPHAQPCVTAGDDGSVPFQFNFRPHDPDRTSFTMENLERFGEGFDAYFGRYAQTGHPGVDQAKIQDASDYRKALRTEASSVRLEPATAAPTEFDMAVFDELSAEMLKGDYKSRLTRAQSKFLETQQLDTPKGRWVLSKLCASVSDSEAIQKAKEEALKVNDKVLAAQGHLAQTLAFGLPAAC